MATRDLTCARLRELLTYDPQTGLFHWNIDKGPHAPAGGLAGALTGRGYRSICVDARRYRAHRLAWLYVHGTWPSTQIDHINGVKDDNRIANLRDVNNQHNKQNTTRANRDNATGMLGVKLRRVGFSARIEVNGREHWLGTFPTAEEAQAAYFAAKRELHPGAVGI